MVSNFGYRELPAWSFNNNYFYYGEVIIIIIAILMHTFKNSTYMEPPNGNVSPSSNNWLSLTRNGIYSSCPTALPTLSYMSNPFITVCWLTATSKTWKQYKGQNQRVRMKIFAVIKSLTGYFMIFWIILNKLQFLLLVTWNSTNLNCNLHDSFLLRGSKR